MKFAEIIVRYLESNKRLVIPQLGAFIVKSPGRSVIFSELLRRDDGVLRTLLMEHGMGELEAAGSIDRFVFDARHAMKRGEAFVLDGLGAIRYDDDENIVFRYAPHASHADLAAFASAVKSRKIDEPIVSTSAKVQPESYVKGLRYTSKSKIDDTSYSYASRSRFARMDKFLLLAILAAVLAVSAIVYGYIREQRINEAEMEYEIEQRRVDVNSDAPEYLPGADETH